MRAWMMLGLLALTACGSDEQSTTVAGTTYTSNDKTNSATISNDRGSISTVSGDAAAKTEMPDFAPRYPGATIDSVIETQSEGRKSTMISLITSDAPAKVAEFYKGRFAAAGLKPGMTMVSDEGGLVSAEGQGMKASIAVNAEEGKTTIVVTYSKA